MVRSDTRERVLAAAAALLADHGPSALTTRRVAAAAGVQPPTLYRLFGEKDGLIEALAADAFDRFLAGAMRDDGGDAVGMLRDGWRESLRFAQENPDLYRLLQSLKGPAARSRTGRAFASLRSRVAAVDAVGLLAVSEDRAVDLLFAAGDGVIQTRLDHPEDLDDRLGDDMLEAVLSVILLRPLPPASHSTPAAAGRLLHALAGDESDALGPAETALLREWLGRLARR